MLSPALFELLAKRLSHTIPASRICTDPLFTLARGTDAGLYRLIPGIVVRVDSETELISLIHECRESNLPITFKAGGTSLSGQTITNSVLVETGDGFSGFSTDEKGLTVNLQCGLTGSLANARLAKYGRRIGPDPSSLNSARIGGIVSNNASGGAFGIIHNSYNTLQGMRIILADGSLIDTRDPVSRKEFSSSHHDMLKKLENLSIRVRSDSKMSDKIRHKYELKNTCGYGVNALLDFTDPLDILEHLMVGAEGTLGFISEVTFKTVEEFPLKATSLVFFPTVRDACHAISLLKDCFITAAELMDRNALRAVQARPGMPEELKILDDESAALLIDTSARSQEELETSIKRINQVLAGSLSLFPVQFTSDRIKYAKLWKVRKGLFTSAAASRPAGTACIIEDLAFRADVLPDAIADLRELTEKYGYRKTVIWGHILDGNFHFVITPDFNKQGSTENYHRFMQEMAELTIRKYDGSLKGEHGTGRNMAPFVKEEWGNDIYGVMQEIKEIIDPDNLFNPGVILNSDPFVHTKNLKFYPVADEIIDTCIECGFCEVSCSSRSLTLTPRQRIVVFREMTRLLADGSDAKRLRTLQRGFQYNGDATCATDGMCATACPVDINTGILVKKLRMNSHGIYADWIADRLAGNMAVVTAAVRYVLGFIAFIHTLIGTRFMTTATGFLHKASGRKIPLWNPFMPSNTKNLQLKSDADDLKDQVLYFPSCINRTFGKSTDYGQESDLIRKTEALLRKAGFAVKYPDNTDHLCCGMAFDSKGFKRQGERKARELEKYLLRATENGRIPVYCDMSPCLQRMKETLDERLRLFEPVEFILTYFPGRLDFSRLPVTVALHSTCSNTKMGLDQKLVVLAGMCAKEVVVPDEIGCCGWAGDRGFSYPELNASALKALKSRLPQAVEEGFSTSRTCEIGLSLHSGISYKSIVYLVDKATSKGFVSAVK